MKQYIDTVIDELSDLPIPDAEVFVYNDDSTDTTGATLATLYASDGTTEIGNPLTTNAQGEYSFYQDTGEFTALVYYGSRLRRRLRLLVGGGYVVAAQTAAAAALAAAGVGEYANTALGLAGTTIGETFWVDLGTGLGQVYRHDAGPTATALQSFIIDPTGSGAADVIGKAGGGTVQDHVSEVASLIAADALNTNAVSTNFGLGTLALAGTASGNGQNTAMGYEALTASTTAFSNVAIGHLTLKSVTTDGGGLGYGSNQVAVGAGTLRDCTTGQSNTAVGRACMPTATTASYNSVFGHASGFSITTGFYNSAFGSDSLGLCTTGSRNTAGGFLALGANVSGNDNVALGYHASKLATTANRTIAIGAQSLQNNTADNVIAIGFTAGLSNTSGVQNLFIGRQTGYSCDTGGQNVALGENALFSATGATSNTAVGVNALFSNISSENTSLGAGTGNSGATGAADVTGGGNTFIGHRASASSAAAAGTLALGKDAVATIASGATSAHDGPGIAIGAASTPVGFRGDGTIYPAAGASAGYMRVKINGTHYKIQLFADA